MNIYTNPHFKGCPWYEITETLGAPNIKWCEETLCQWVSEPANAWSNLGYMISALVITYLSWKNKNHIILKTYGPIVFFMGLTSFFYHQSNFYGSQVMDFVGMFGFLGWLLGINLVRLEKLKGKHLKWFVLSLGLILSLSMHIMYINGKRFQIIVIISAFLILATELAATKAVRTNLKYYVLAILTFAVAFGFSISDHQRLWCHPEQHGWFSQGHAIWHWLGGLGTFFVYLYHSQPILKPQENR